MKKSTKAITLGALLGSISLFACAAQLNKSVSHIDSTSPAQELKVEDILFKFDAKGNLVPVMVSGKKFEPCGKETGRDCKIFTKPVNVTDVENIDITIIKSHNSPDCAYVTSSRSRRGAAAVTAEGETCF